MPICLILKADGTFERKNIKKGDSLQKEVHGNITIVPHIFGIDAKITAYANEEGAMEKLPINLWSFLLHKVGFIITWTIGGITGNVVITGELDVNGNYKAVPVKFVKLVEEVKQFKGHDDKLLDFIDNYPFVTSMKLHPQHKNDNFYVYANMQETKRRKYQEEFISKKEKKKKPLSTEAISVVHTPTSVINQGSLPKIPYRIQYVKEQILKHPHYSSKLHPSAKSLMEGTSQPPIHKNDNNKHYRSIWKYLYLNEKPSFDWFVAENLISNVQK